MKVIVGSDHAGFNLKERLKKYLDKQKIDYIDIGGFSNKKPDDYSDYAVKAARIVVKDKDSMAILVCGSGTGMTIAANKVRGIRAVAAYDTYSAKMSRHDNDTNVLGLRGRSFPYKKAEQIVSVWLKTPFSKIPRHKRRISKLARIRP